MEDAYYTSDEYKPLIGKLGNVCYIALTITQVLYCINRLQGNITSKSHNGLKLFWTGMAFGDVMCSSACFTTYVVVALYFQEKVPIGQTPTVLCSKPVIYPNLGILLLLVWISYSVSILRATLSITWLHEIKHGKWLQNLVESLSLCLTSVIAMAVLWFIKTFNVELNNADNDGNAKMPEGKLEEYCFPLWTYTSISYHTVTYGAAFWYVIAIILACLKVLFDNKKVKMSYRSVFLLIITHYVPVNLLGYATSIWMQKHGFPALVAVVVYCVVIAATSVSNFMCYKLYSMASPHRFTEYDAVLKEKQNKQLLQNNDDVKMLSIVEDDSYCLADGDVKLIAIADV